MLLRDGKHFVSVHQTACVKCGCSLPPPLRPESLASRFCGIAQKSSHPKKKKTDDVERPSGNKVNPMCESVVKEVLARTDPARGEHA